jgi:hypothetical protein
VGPAALEGDDAACFQLGLRRRSRTRKYTLTFVAESLYIRHACQ